MPDISFRTTCKDCKFNGRCLLAGNNRMIKKRCYIDSVTEKLKIKQETVVERCNTVLQKYGIWNFSFRFNLDYYADRENTTITNDDIKILYAVANCYFSAWRDDEYIHCAKCGDLIKNSKQRNRKYCEKCKVNNRKTYNLSEILKTCIDCGVKFYPDSNREIRCIYCQIKANKASARERARRYRERKRNGLESKS